MDAKRFDALARVLSTRPPTRRSLLQAALGLAAVGELRATSEGDAKRRRKRRNNRRNGRGCKRKCKGARCGASDGCGGTCQSGSCPTGEVCDGGVCRGDGADRCSPACGANRVCADGQCIAGPDRCYYEDICGGVDYIPCGESARGEPNMCYRTVEGNTACFAFDISAPGKDCSQYRTCSSTEECRQTSGFHYYCMAPNPSHYTGVDCGCGGRCVPESDFPHDTCLGWCNRNGPNTCGGDCRCGPCGGICVADVYDPTFVGGACCFPGARAADGSICQ